jgi:8-oxo-dGTP diphosphatase
MLKQLPPDEYYRQLAKVPTAGGAILRNSKGEFLIVKQSYKNDWHIAGGMADEHENPRETTIREVKEELGITVPQARAFCVDFAKTAPYDRILFVFDCGVLDDETIKTIKIDGEETVEFKFVPYEEMITLVSKKISQRLQSSIEALRNGTCVYLENGLMIEK